MRQVASYQFEFRSLGSSKSKLSFDDDNVRLEMGEGSGNSNILVYGKSSSENMPQIVGDGDPSSENGPRTFR